MNLQDLPLQPEQARAARNYFGLSQAKLAEQSGLPINKIKRFEPGPGRAGWYIPDSGFLTDLRAFFEEQGYVFDDTPQPGAKAKQSGLVFPAGVVGSTKENQGATEKNRPQATTFHHMRIALQDPQMGAVLDLIEANERKAEDLLALPLERGFFGGLSEGCQGRQQEVHRLLAENGVLFARLFGRAIGGEPKAEVLSAKREPQTQGELLHAVQGAALTAATDDNEPKKSQPARRGPKDSSPL